MHYSFKHFLEKLAHEKAAGPSPTFSVFHLLVAIELIAEKPIGRSKLAESLEVGGGVVRTIVDRLKNAGLLETSKTGCSLTEKGMKLWKEYSSIIMKVEMKRNELALADYSFAVLINNHGQKVESGMEQRDAAVMMGAKSVTTVVSRKGRLIIPSVSNDVVHDFPHAAAQILRLLSPKENDAIVISSADNPGKAKYGALSAAWTLINDS